ncbi:MAG: VWA domain-containing protein [Proteobacteria bacterium]|nr:VWA domain-containing protein [Pseudomonadota bacterium]
MDWSQPTWLIAGLGVCLGLVFFFRVLAQKRQAGLEKFVAQQLIGRLTGNISSTKRHLKKLLILVAVFLCFVALARPQVGYQWVEVKRKGIDILFALDTSKSMLAEDIKPNRLQRASLAILDFVEKLEGDRVGLLPFAGSAYLMCPLTIDYDAFLHSLSTVNTDLIPVGGTNLATVIEKAVQTLSNAANHKILIILTDGENLQGDALQAAEASAKEGLTIYAIGVGTSQGELIPVKSGGSQGFVKDSAGNFVTSRLDATTLTQIAEKSGGLYTPLGPAGEGLETIYRQKLALIPKEELAERRHKVPIERFEWPLALAIILLMVELLIGERKVVLTLPLLPFAKSLLRRFKWPRAGKVLGIGIALLLMANMGSNGYASEGEDAYQRGDYLQASEYYQKKLVGKPEDPQLLYNFGTAAYKNNMYDDAIAAFSGALKSDRIDLQKKAYYNRGNSYYQKGSEVRQADAKAAAGLWRQALNSLNSALELDPADPDAKHNQSIVAKQLEELEKQLEKEKQEKQDNQGEQNDQQKDKDSDKKDQGQQKEDEKGSEPVNQDKQQAEQKSDEKSQQQTDEKTDEGKAKQESLQPGEDKPGEAQGPPAGAEQQQEEQDKAAEQAANDAMRQKLGKMTKEEAEQLLNALKNQEGNLNFVPSGRRAKEKDIDRDW